MTPSARPCRCVPLSQQTQKRALRVGTSPLSPAQSLLPARGMAIPRPEWCEVFSSVLRACCAWRELFSTTTGNYWQQVATHAA